MAEPDLTIRKSITDKILNDILSGRLNPGDRLPSERELAASFGVSRSIVHLAFEELARAGFLEVRPRSGNYVADFVNRGNCSTLDLLSRVDAGSYRQSYQESMVEIRNVLESLALKTISCRNREEDFKVLEEKLAALIKIASETPDVVLVADCLKQYHMEIMRRGGNFISTMVMNSFYENSSPLWERCVSFWGIETTLQQNEKILRLLKEGRGEECADLINGMFSTYKKATSAEKNG